MKVFRTAFVLGACATTASGESAAANPLGKVLELINNLAAQITKDGEVEAKAYQEYFQWCDEVSQNGQFAVETATKEVGKQTALLAKLESDIDEASGRVESLASAVATSEKELKTASDLRKKEAADFAAGERELVETIDVLARATGTLRKNAAALTQVDGQSMANMLQALSVVLDAASFSAADQRKLAAFVQARQGDEDSEAEPGAPAAAVYDSKSGGIVEVIEDMKDKAEEQLRDLRKAETTNRHNFNMVKQSLEDKLSADSKDMDGQKVAKAKAEEGKATAQGDLEAASKDLSSSKEELATARTTCMASASDHEATEAARKEELKVVAGARKTLEETTGAAGEQSYSFAQLGTELQSRTRHSKVVSLVRALAKKHRSAALAQLASRIATVTKFRGLSHGSPFGKVKDMISEMVAKLEKEMQDEVAEKAYCDEQMERTGAKQSDLEDDAARLTASIDSAASKSAGLKEQVKELQAELASMDKEQAEMDKIRQDGHAAYETSKADLEMGLGGVRKALTILRDYYGSSAALVQDDAQFAALMQQPVQPAKHEKSAGAGQSILGILEVVESDFATNLAKEENEEAEAQSGYEKTTQESKVARAEKTQDVKYKNQEVKSLDTTISEVSADQENANAELSAVSDYDAKLKQRCVAKPETYEARKGRREAEISGLKEALSVLEDDAALVQRSSHRASRRAFRGTKLAVL